MKILIIAHKMPYPPRGGATLRNYNLLKECAKENEIHLLTFTQEPYLRDPAKMQASIDHLKGFCREVQVFKIPTDRSRISWYLLLLLNIFSPTPYSVWRFWSRKMVRAIKQQLKQYEFDGVEIGCISLVRYARLMPHLPKLMIHHNIESQLLFRRSKTAGNFLARLYLALQARKVKRLEKIASRQFDHHTTVSKLDKKTLLDLCPGINVTVVDNGVDTDYFTPSAEPPDRNTLVFAGAMAWYPNADAMIYFAREIWPLLKRDFPEIKINLVGASPPPELTELNRNDPAFRLLGFVDDVRPYVSQAAVYVVPITVGGGTRLKILDAMAMGKAIVSTSIGCEGISVADGREIIIADSPEVFAAKIGQLLHDPDLACKIGENARKTVMSTYSWKKIAPELTSVYAKLARIKRQRNQDATANA